MVVAALGTVLAAGYLLWLLQRTAFGTSRVNPALAAAGHGGGHGGGHDDDHGNGGGHGGHEDAAAGEGHEHSGEGHEHEHIHDVHVSEWLAWAPLLALIVALGVYPNIVFKSTDPAVRESTLQEECLHEYDEADCASVFRPKHSGSEREETAEEGG
jgi:NADH-quinone oxidoreductase subunit M